MSTIPDHFRRLFTYEQDSHQKVLSALNAASDSARASEFFQMAVDIMGHVFAARMVWLWRIGAVPTRPEGIFPKGMTFPELEQEMLRTHSAWGDYLAHLDDAEVARVIEYTTLDGRAFKNSIEEMLVQLHGHSMYHRGQVALWLRQAGAEPVSTDYILWVRENQL